MATRAAHLLKAGDQFVDPLMKQILTVSEDARPSANPGLVRVLVCGNRGRVILAANKRVTLH